MQRAPTLHPGPCLVFLDPAKKGLRYPNLKIKTSLLLQLQLIVSTHSSHTHITVKCAHCRIISSTTSTSHVSSICCQFCIKHIINLYITLLALYLHPQTVIWHITSAALNHHSVITSILYYAQHLLILSMHYIILSISKHISSFSSLPCVHRNINILSINITHCHLVYACHQYHFVQSNSS